MKDFVTCYYCLPSSQAEQDRELFRSILGKVCERCGFRVDSYVLMRNHYHLLVENPSGEEVRRIDETAAPELLPAGDGLYSGRNS